MCRWFESNLAPHIARFQGFISDRINLPREVHVPKRSIINHRWCLDVEVASEYIHLLGGIWKHLEFTCEEADLMPWPLYNKVASKGRSAQLQIGSNAASTLSFFIFGSIVIIGYFILSRYITICAILVLGVLSLHECRREPRAHGWIKGAERAPYYRWIVSFKILNILHFKLHDCGSDRSG